MNTITKENLSGRLSKLKKASDKMIMSDDFQYNLDHGKKKQIRAVASLNVALTLTRRTLYYKFHFRDHEFKGIM